MLKVTKVVKGDGGLDRKLRQIVKISAQMKCGFFTGATEANGESSAEVAFRNETGAEGIPRRPFLHETLKKNQKYWTEIIVSSLKQSGKMTKATVAKAYELAGQDAKGAVVETINEWPPNKPRPNAPATIERKRRRARPGKGKKGGKNQVPINPNKVLYDTGDMSRNVAYKVEVKG